MWKHKHSLCSGLNESTRSWKLPVVPEPDMRSHMPVSQPCSMHLFSLSHTNKIQTEIKTKQRSKCTRQILSNTTNQMVTTSLGDWHPSYISRCKLYDSLVTKSWDLKISVTVMSCYCPCINLLHKPTRPKLYTPFKSALISQTPIHFCAK